MKILGFRWRRCTTCRSLFVENPPSAEAVASLYRGRNYFANPVDGSAEGGPLGYRDYLADRPHIERKFDQVLERLERHAAPGELLDAGAGPGLMLAVAHRRGWSASGVDANPWAAGYAREQLGVDVRTGWFGAAALEEGRFRAVTMMDFLEHVADPEDAVARAAQLTHPGGLLAVLTPNADSLVGTLLGPRWPEAAKVPGHLTLFSPSGLSSLLERRGYEVLGWHSVGKTSTAATLLRDAAPVAPAAARLLRPLGEIARIGGRVVTIDPHTKLCLYARLRWSTTAGAQAAAETGVRNLTPPAAGP